MSSQKVGELSTPFRSAVHEKSQSKSFIGYRRQWDKDYLPQHSHHSDVFLSFFPRISVQYSVQA